MSEYQYYEFRAIDKPLTEKEKVAVSALSSRAYVTSHVASFVYNYGDFRGNPEKLISSYFDAMLYMTNWGSRHLMFRIPAGLIDTGQVGLYCISEEIDRRTTKDKKYVIVDLEFDDEDLSEWTEGEGWLDELVGLREELIQGDFRVLYLAWLKAAEGCLGMEAIDEETLEPPVPPGLNELSPALKTFVTFLGINEEMFAVAAEKSGKKTERKLQVETWVERLPEAEKHDFLIRLSREEKNLSVLLNRRLEELAARDRSISQSSGEEKRTISALIEAATTHRQKKKEEKRREAELVRGRKLEALAQKESEVWREVDAFIQERQSSAYDKAVKRLKELHDLAEYRGNIAQFRYRIEEIERTYSRRPALISRLKRAKLL